MTGRTRACVALAALLTLAACTSGTPRRQPPRGVTGCSRMFTIGDADTGLGLDWDPDDHPYGRSAFLYVCDGTGVGVTVEAPPHVTVTPAEATVGAPALLQFDVRVDRGAAGALRVTFRERTGGVSGDVRLPHVVAERDAWHLAG